MKKALFIFSLLFGFCLSSKAQFKEIAVSPEFNEPYSAATKFLLMKNGNLILADGGFRDSIRLRIYNKAHQEIAVTSYTINRSGKRTYLGLMEALEINGDAVLFVITEEDKADVLYRVIIDPNSGKVIKEEKIFGLVAEGKEDYYACLDNFIISKCADSDDYAIAYCNNLRSDKIKKVEVVLFDKDHFEVGRSYYETEQKKIESLRFCRVPVYWRYMGKKYQGHRAKNVLRHDEKRLCKSFYNQG
jgi:hypothetical protein